MLVVGHLFHVVVDHVTAVFLDCLRRLPLTVGFLKALFVDPGAAAPGDKAPRGKQPIDRAVSYSNWSRPSQEGKEQCRWRIAVAPLVCDPRPSDTVQPRYLPVKRRSRGPTAAMRRIHRRRWLRAKRACRPIYCP